MFLDKPLKNQQSQGTLYSFKVRCKYVETDKFGWRHFPWPELKESQAIVKIDHYQSSWEIPAGQGYYHYDYNPINQFKGNKKRLKLAVVYNKKSYFGNSIGIQSNIDI